MLTAIGDVMRRVYERGWITTRDGNISMRKREGRYLYITPSSWIIFVKLCSRAVWPPGQSPGRPRLWQHSVTGFAAREIMALQGTEYTAEAVLAWAEEMPAPVLLPAPSF